MPALLLALPMIAWMIGVLEAAGRARAAAACSRSRSILGAIDGFEIAGPRELVLAGIVLAIAGGAIALAASSWMARRSIPVLVAWLALFGIVGLGGAKGIERRVNDNRYAALDPGIDVVLRAAPTGKRIGLAGVWSLGELSPVWPSFGARIGNEVQYVGRMPPNGFLQRYPDEASFQAALRRGRFDLLVVGRGIAPDPQTPEQRWALDAGWRTIGLTDRFRVLAPPAQ